MITCMKIKILATFLFVCLGFCKLEAVSKVCFETACFDVKLAKTPDQRRVGLTQTPLLKKEEGMLFLYASKGYYSYWMKGMSYPIDILWLDENRKVVTLQEGVPPCVLEDCPLYSSNHPALYVLEISAGAAKNYNISYGSQARFK